MLRRMFIGFLLFQVFPMGHMHTLMAQERARQKIVFTPQWTAQSQFAAFYVGISQGFYRAAGIDLEIRYPYTTNNMLSHLGKGKADVISMNLVQAMIERSKGTRIVNIMQSSQQSGLLIVANRPVEGFSSLKGLKVGRWKSGHTELIEIIAKEGGVKLQWVLFNKGVNLFLGGYVDAMTAMTYNEFVAIQESGRRIHENQLIRFSDIGYNIPDDGLYVEAEYFKTHQDILRKFVQETKKSWEWTRMHPEEALQLVMAETRRQHVPTNPYHQLMMLKEVLRLQLKQGETEAPYVLNENDFHFVNVLLVRGGYMNKPLSYLEFKPSL